MEADVLDQLVLIMDKLMLHPITNSKVSCSSSSVNEVQPIHYYLDKVKLRLKADKYSSIQEWERDVMSTFDPPDNHQFSKIISDECKRLFKKEKQMISCKHNIKEWCSNLCKLRNKELSLLTSAPKVIQDISHTIPSYRKMVPVKEVNEKDLSNFMKAAELIKSEEDQNELLNLISDLQPELSPEAGQTNVWIDVTKLSVSTFNTLVEHVKDILRKQGTVYPE
ncbi:Bromodomain containing protein [Histomonas meleagridis]|uniref:Bromodomain containing protein n=1 Tax=Histomonas meleagridis TaxID=135588 RepID=UPI00355AC121|nr:Bromodomain containing protein [Histomonas meleagridis]KAH0806268.1 Bromodomain containing protein [Histomonas meleagridis]